MVRNHSIQSQSVKMAVKVHVFNPEKVWMHQILYNIHIHNQINRHLLKNATFLKCCFFF